ncbi:MAG: hypothetical protein H7Y09_04900 [Chitinophagaceae bacterium]|nr:hypothetical protein [Anaerolineae bacterium]
MSRTDYKGLICLNEDIRNDIGAIVECLVEFSQLYDPEHDYGQVYWWP